VQHRGELTVADVDAREIGMGAKDAQCLLIALPLIVMPLDERADPERSTERVQAGLEAAQLFRMFVRRQPAGEECGLPAAGVTARQELADDSAGGVRGSGYRCETAGARASVTTQTTGMLRCAASSMYGFSR